MSKVSRGDRDIVNRTVRALASLSRKVPLPGRERVARKIHPPGSRNPIETRVTLPSGIKMDVSTADFIEWQLLFLGAYEPEVSALFSRFMSPGTYALDVGANIGTHSLAMAVSMHDGHVVAFEPNPRLRRRLSNNVRINEITNLVIDDRAVSNESGRVTLHTPGESWSNQGMSSLLALADWDEVEVDATTLDDFAQGLDRSVSLIKIDVEGWEGAVLAGARHLLERDSPALIFEFQEDYWSMAGYSLNVVIDDLRSCGYVRFMRIDSRGLEPLTGSPPASMNVLAVSGQV